MTNAEYSKMISKFYGIGGVNNLMAYMKRTEAALDALRLYVKKGHHDTCSHALSKEYSCDCGFSKGKEVLGEQ